MVNINSETGDIISLQSFNYEELKMFQFKVQATDSGVPPLSSNVTVNVLILDENDNNPTILAPYSEHGSVNSESIPYSAEAGYFVAKIRAISYSIFEEVDKGAAVGNLAKDLNLSVQQLQSSGLQITSGYKPPYFDINLESGVLFVSERIDREELCPNTVKCSLNIEAILSNPRSLHRIEVVINDINDNAPSFQGDISTIDMYESSYVGERHPLPIAHDPDVGANSVKTYKLNANDYFSLDIQSTGDQSVSAELVLQKALDREKQAVIELTLTAIDGGKSPKTGTLQIQVNVLDVNDNSPVFSKSLYKVQVIENANIGTPLLTLTASDLDDGINGQVVYTFTERGRLNPDDKFSLNNNTGEITVRGNIDYEENQAFEIRVQARDRGTPPRSAHGKVLVEVIDVNDNAPEISVSSIMSSVKEDAEIGTAVAMVTITDQDGGKNGLTNCKITGSVPFKLKSNYKNYYSLLVDRLLDRETVSRYDIYIVATDEGTPSLSSTTVITIHVSDVNDNPPKFPNSPITLYVKENSPIGTTIHKLTTTDLDLNENAKSMYHLISSSSKTMQMASMVTVNSETGDIVSLHSFNYEELKTFHFKVQATDSGVPPLTSNVTVNILILDENDNTSDTLKSDVVVFPAPFPPVDGELISINGGDTFTKTQTLPNKEKLYKRMWLSGLFDKNGKDVKANVDYEEYTAFEIRAEANDKAQPPMSAHCKVLVEVIDVNDNAPAITVTSLLSSVKEDAGVGTAIALVSVLDRDGESVVNVYVKENSKVGEIIKRVTAHDADTDRNSQMRN
ncbi:protocadherin-10-like [Pundamilia nyererei]|uniref:Protocadherin-10-like n=1 Tax=Pundamilia nyererei TaxID=303518 RepID=A0A9Y3QP34_9CICH|nr:PREDICTED: protocadherin-10-like [Pundamilia nyererei]